MSPEEANLIGEIEMSLERYADRKTRVAEARAKLRECEEALADAEIAARMYVADQVVKLREAGNKITESGIKLLDDSETHDRCKGYRLAKREAQHALDELDASLSIARERLKLDHALLARYRASN